MDALDLLEEQHRDVGAMIDRIAAEPSAGRQGMLVAAAVRAVLAHSRAEERAFYGAFAGRIGGDDGRLYEAFEHHALLRFAASNLLRTRPSDVRFSARLEVVRQLFGRHASAEEDWMFPRAKRTFRDEELDRIGVEIERAHALRMEVGPLLPERPRRPRQATRPGDARPAHGARAASAHRAERRDGAAHR